MSFVDEIGRSIREDPELQQQLRLKLKQAEEDGEMEEFVAEGVKEEDKKQHEE